MCQTLVMAAARIAATLLLAALPVSLAAQRPVQVHLTIRVTDVSGAVVPDGQVNIGSSNLQAEFSAITDSTGKVDFEVAPGSYVISVSVPGFKPWSKNIVLGGDSSQSVAVTAALNISGQSSPCLIVAGPEIPLRVESVQLPMFIPSETLHNLALAARPVRKKLW